MARTKALSLLQAASTKADLKEIYGIVIENIQRDTVRLYIRSAALTLSKTYSSGAGVRGHTKKSPHSPTSLTATVIRRFLLYRKRQYSISDVTINSVRSIPLILKFTGGNFYGTLYRCYRQA